MQPQNGPAAAGDGDETDPTVSSPTIDSKEICLLGYNWFLILFLAAAILRK